ncbi:MAG: epoxyqueuosine reductase [Actinobacteria bacterium]|jgi:epoxyqueuosine reductase QueG|nr:MAG: epoxyqueuosine reductase [Actinomycetota bacterium]
MGLFGELQDIAAHQGVDYLGVADTAIAADAVREQGGDNVAAFPRAVSIGIILPHAVVDQLPRRSEPDVAMNYLHHAYDVINERLDLATSRLSSLLQRRGHRVLPIPAKEHHDEERLCAMYSHKMAAHLAGLGWIGKSCLLVTPEDGPRVRWSTVLTYAPLEPTGEPMDERCGECGECVDICPVGAFTGRSFVASEPRDARYEARACREYFNDLEGAGRLPACGLCLYVCPYGRR